MGLIRVDFDKLIMICVAVQCLLGLSKFRLGVLLGKSEMMKTFFIYFLMDIYEIFVGCLLSLHCFHSHPQHSTT